MDTQLSLRVFVTVAELGGFAPAARRLEMSPSAVSRYVADLEQDLGVQLFARNTRRTRLTEAGGLALERACEILQSTELLRQEMSEMTQTPRGHLKVSAPTELGEKTIAPLIAEFATRYPEIRIALDFSERVVDLVAEGFDLAIRSGDLPDSRLVARRLGDVPYATCASPGYLSERAPPAHPRDLAEHDCIHWAIERGEDVWSFLEDGRTIEVAVTGRFAVNSFAAERAAARAGLGVAMLPAHDLEEEIAAGRLVQVLGDFEVEPDPIHLVWPRSAHEPLKRRVLIDFLFAALKTNA